MIDPEDKVTDAVTLKPDQIDELEWFDINDNDYYQDDEDHGYEE
jgi:hypothetical protein